jgi:serine/threonine protein kinase
MVLSVGTKLGPDEILATIGAGGMREVYRARDAKLGPDVALKVQPKPFAPDAERMARFQGEAKVLASLNHPNIAIVLILIVLLSASLGGPAVSFCQDTQTVAVNPQETHKQLETLACDPATVNFKVRTVRDFVPLPSQPADKAIVFILRPTHYGGSIQTKVAVDGHWVGANEMKNYFYVVLPPGNHYFCSQSENRSLLALNVEAGKTYFVQQHILPGMLKAQNALEVLDEKQGKESLAKCKPSGWEVKN